MKGESNGGARSFVRCAVLQAFAIARISLTFLELYSFMEIHLDRGLLDGLLATVDRIQLQVLLFNVLKELSDEKFIGRCGCDGFGEIGDEIQYYPAMKSASIYANEYKKAHLIEIDTQSWADAIRRNREGQLLSRERLVQEKMKALHEYNDSRDLGYKIIGKCALAKNCSVKDIIRQEGITLE